jgi:hypothetical protein
MTEREEVGKFKDFTIPGGEKMKKAYKNKVIWLHVSKKGDHLYAFANEGEFHNVKSILMNRSEVEDLLSRKVDGIKISIMDDEDDGSKAEGR